MAIIRNAANTLKKGRVGETTYYISKGQQVARQSRNDSNYGESARRTQLQQNRRVLWANLVEFYKISARWMPKAFESKGPGQTDYNKFMAVNVPTARIALTKAESEAAGCVVDGYVVSQGSLPSIEIEQTVNGYRTNIALGELTITADTTIAEFSLAAIQANANIREGMQLSCAVYTQSVDPLGTPRAICRLYEITIDTHSSSKLRAYFPEFISNVVSGNLGTVSNMPAGGFAYILTELQGGGLKVSTQLLTTLNSDLISQYSSSAQVERAAQSYGVDSEVVLNPDTLNAQGEEGVQGYITRFQWPGTDISDPDQVAYPGDYIGEWGRWYDKTIQIYTQGLTDQTVSNAKVYDGVFSVTEETATIDGNGVISVKFSGIGRGSNRIISKVTITLSDGLVLEADFLTTTPGA